MNDDLKDAMLDYARAILKMELMDSKDDDRQWKAAHRAANAAREKMVALSRKPAEVPLVRLGQGEYTTDYTPAGEKK